MTSSNRTMTRCIVLLVAVMLSAAASAQTLVVANRDGGSISLIDLTTRMEMARLPVGSIIPHEVAVSPDGQWGISGEYGTTDNPGRRLIVFDVKAARITGFIDLGPESRPHSMAFLPDNRHAVATMERSDKIALVDIYDRRVIRTFATGGREGHMVRLGPDGKRAYVTSRGGAGTLSVIYLDRDRPPEVIETGKGAEGIAVSPDGGEVWVANRLADTVSVIDTQSLQIVAELTTRPEPRRIEMTADGRAVVSNGSTRVAYFPYIQIFDIAARTLVREIPLRAGVPEKHVFGIATAGKRLFLADRMAYALLVYDLDSLATPRLLAENQPEPDGLAYSPIRLGVFGE